jgi:hypothetical protein
MKTTKKDFRLFQNTAKAWLDIFGLKEYEVFSSMMKAWREVGRLTT